eukprot:bmy_00867T0
MQVLMAAFLVWTLMSPQGRGTEAWPTHTACRDGSLQVLYQSCGEDVEELFLDIALFSKGLSILNFSYPICEADLPKFSFCGRRKGASLGSTSGPLAPAEGPKSGDWADLLS